MATRRILRRFLTAFFALVLTLSAAVSHAGLTDKLKKKVGDKAGQKTDQAADKAVDGAAGAVTGEGGGDAGGAAPGSSEGEPAGEGGGSAGSGATVSEVSTKFDFVPGDKVLFSDDFTQDELGEFPARWKLTQGTFEVAEMKGERWVRCTSNDGRIRMKMPAVAALPEFWTLEFDFYGVEPMASAFQVRAMCSDDRPAWEATFPNGPNLFFRSGEVYSTTDLEAPGTVPGRHHFMFMARGPAIKVYIDRQRMASVPEISTASGPPVAFEIRLAATSKPMITNVRFAEGCKPAKDMLASGKLVTYGIRFASGSDVVQPESAPILRQIAAYLEANPAVKLQIVGHTDNTGTAAGNLDLSKRRAASVARMLAEEFKIAADRFTADGKGDTETVASNEQAEGRAMNRRVEFKKV